jgi:asparagine synthetase A
MVEAKLLRKKLKNGLIVDKWDLVTIIEKQQAEIDELKDGIEKLKDAYCQKDHEVKKAEQYCLDAFERGKQIGYADGMISRKAQEK